MPLGTLGGGKVTPAFSDHSRLTPIALTTTPQLVTGWTENIVPVDITEDTGVFTVNNAGTYSIQLERIYKNTDNNPSVGVNLTIDVRKNGVTSFTRTAPITAANAPSEPSIDTFTTPFIKHVEVGDYFEVYVSAEDDGSPPAGTNLVNMRVVTHKVYT